MKLRKTLAILLVACLTLTQVSMTAFAEIGGVDEPETKQEETIKETVEESIEKPIEETKQEITEEATKSETQEAGQDDEDEDEDEESGTIVLTSNEVEGMVVTLKANATAFPDSDEGELKLSVQEVTEDEAEAASENLEDKTENDNVAKRVTYDIKVMDGDEEVEPEEEVKVEFALTELPSGADAVKVYHHEEDGDIDTVASEAIKDADKEEDEITVKGETESFSLYTVDFTYEDKTVSIAGDTEENKLTDILEELGITEDIEDVEVYQDDEFEDKAEEDADGKQTVKEGKKELFSVYEEGNEWYVDAINAFDTEHGLVVKTADGAEYKIKVTDPEPVVFYTVTFNLNGGDLIDVQMLTITNKGWSCSSGNYIKNFDCGTDYSTIIGEWSACSPCKSGCTFDKWTPESGTLTGDTTFNANYKAPHTVTFDVQGHGTAPKSQTVEEGNLVPQPAAPTDTGYTFGGWYKEEACKTAWDFANDTVSSDTTLYAKWIQEVSYIDADGSTKTCDNYTLVTATDSQVTWTDGWYVVDGTVTLSNGAVCSGDVHLILKDGSSLTVKGANDKAGICVSGTGNNLTIYGQSGQAGTLNATGGHNGAGIGGGWKEDGKNITINGGTVTATGGAGGAGIGGGVRYSSQGGHASDITINGGTVTATGGNDGGADGAGIGSGAYSSVYSNIFVADNLVIKADGNNPPTTVITHTSSQDIASSLAGQRYVTVAASTPEPTPTPSRRSSSGGSSKASVTYYGTGSRSVPARGNWAKNSDGKWNFGNKGNTKFTNTWGYIQSSSGTSSNWYYFDANGNMQTGWQTINGRRYYFCPDKDSREGIMETGWKFIDGKWHCFATSKDGNEGALLTNTTTSDGFKVDANGVWIQE